jgi:MOSC domain-containing protein YiiM
MTAEELLQLVGKRFRLGDVEMLGVEDCAPCEEPSLLSGKVNFKARFSGLGGLRAKVLGG